jgi:hypothetical protein
MSFWSNVGKVAGAIIESASYGIMVSSAQKAENMLLESGDFSGSMNIKELCDIGLKVKSGDYKLVKND